MVCSIQNLLRTQISELDHKSLLKLLLTKYHIFVSQQLVKPPTYQSLKEISCLLHLYILTMFGRLPCIQECLGKFVECMNT